jgi:hypothetical protein
MSRAEWSAKTGLPPHLFEATREELAYNVFRAQQAKDALHAELLAIEGMFVLQLPPYQKDDALKFVNAQIERQIVLIQALREEWERKK